ncbi:MAG TPA: fibronectin type III domain-containing protein, partial [Verrucomicrobiae bacterium]|nr:fibronectin type III domain-containing protein [Verrucomicrobiae bacterium]
MKKSCKHLFQSLFGILLLGLLPRISQGTDPRQYAVELSASVQSAPPQIALRWAADPSATAYSVFRKAPNANSWTLQENLPGTASTWTDVFAANGSSYEYSVTRSTSAGYTGTGYLLAGINAPAVESRGKIVLIVESTYASALASELARLQQDLIGDGWTVLRHDVSRTDGVMSVKNLITADYYQDPGNVKSVFLFGHVPVPYSGNLNPDGHPDHLGAWPADAYYG